CPWAYPRTGVSSTKARRHRKLVDEEGMQSFEREEREGKDATFQGVHVSQRIATGEQYGRIGPLGAYLADVAGHLVGDPQIDADKHGARGVRADPVGRGSCGVDQRETRTVRVQGPCAHAPAWADGPADVGAVGFHHIVSDG